MPRWADLSRSTHGVGGFLSRSTHGGVGGFLGQSQHGGAGGDSTTNNHNNNSYAQRVLMEECATLRKRVKELEGDTGSGKTSLDSTDSEDVLHQELSHLRKELMKVESEKATMELDFMNQLTQMARDNAEKTEKLTKVEEQLSPLKEAPSLPSNSSSFADGDGDGTSVKDAEIKQLKADLASADKELEVTRKDVDALKIQNGKLQAQKEALIEENTSIRREVDSESKVIMSLNDVMAENEHHFKSRIEKLELEIQQKNATIATKDAEMAEINNTLEKQESANSMLLEEITDIRMQLDRKDASARQMKKKLEDLEQKDSEDSESQRIGSLKQAASDAEEQAIVLEQRIETLENELISIQKAHKGEILKLEESLNNKEGEKEQIQCKLTQKELELRSVKEDHEQLVGETIKLRRNAEEAKQAISALEQEVATLNSQRIFYEKRSTQCIMEHVAEADEAKNMVYKLEKQVKLLERQISAEKEKKQSLTIKKTLPPTFPATPPLPQLSPRPTHVSRSQPSSPAWARKTLPASPSSESLSKTIAPRSPSPRNNVRALAACFEGKNLNSKDHPESDATLTTENDSAHLQYTQEIDSLQSQVAALESCLHDARHQREMLERKLKNQNDSIDRSLEDARLKNEILEQKLKRQSDQLTALLTEVASLNAEKSSFQSVVQKEFEKEVVEYRAQIQRLEKELAGSKAQLLAESKELEKLKSEIREITIDRLSFEERTIQTYEKRAIMSQKTHQAELNNLKVELTKSQMKMAQLQKEHESRVKELDEEIEKLNAECDSDLEEMQGELDMMKHKLDEQLTMVSKLEREREQLCLQMNGVSNKRRNELEELQSDLMKRTAENTSLHRALQSLEMQVEHYVDNSKELEHLRIRVRELESRQGPTGTEKHMQQYHVEKLEDENKKLKDQVRNVTIERRALQEKLNAIVAGQNDDRSSHVLRERNEKLRREVDRLRNKLESMEEGITRISL